MKRITKKSELIELAQELGVRPDWHEPDEQDVTVTVHGKSFDNAGFWPAVGQPVPSSILEKHVVISKNGKKIAAVNLATLFAWATGYEH